MARTKKNSISNILKCKEDNIMKVEWNNIPICIKRVIPVGDMYNIVNNVVGACFSNEGEYTPEVKDFATRLGIIIGYTDIDVVDDMSMKYELCYCTDIFDIVISNASESQILSITDAIEDKIKYLAEANMHFIYRKMDDISNSIDGFVKTAGEIFDGISAEDINSFVKNISGADFNEEKLMSAYIGNKYESKNS